MHNSLDISEWSREEKYNYLHRTLPALLENESDVIASMANFTSILKETFGWFWIGFYRVIGNELVLGPFQGSLACTRIAFGKGVCGSAWLEKRTLIVADVNQFPGHIACSSLSKSEIVIPVFKNDEVIAVLDIDHDEFNTFDLFDSQQLTELLKLLPI